MKEVTVNDPASHTVTLEEPLTRGDTTITHVTLRRPTAGSLRGVALTDAIRMDVDALIKLVPRLSSPALTEHDMRTLCAADLFQFGQEVAGFLLPKESTTAA